MDEFLHSIKRKYKDRLINREKQWPPCHSNKLIRLELVEREKGEKVVDNIQRGSLERRERKARFDHDTIHKGNEKKTVKRTPLVYDDMFEMKSGKRPVRKILVEGDAGIGKTTLSVSISEDWSREMLFKEFELVLLLPLRHKKVASACSLPELLKLLHPSADVCKSVASYIEEEEAEKVLVIADGWDELSESKRQEGSFLYELLFETFPLMSVVVTSQPSASAPLHRLPCIDRFVVINGFGKDGIEEYVHCEFSSEHEKACRLLEQLKDNPLVESVCSVPLSCAIVCHLWRTSEEALPSTMTQLYTKIILNVILRNIRKKDSFKNVLSLPNFKSLPKELQQSFSLLCEFAFKALKENRIAYSQDELSEFFPQGSALDENILCFGLLQSAETVLETGRRVSFHFLHLTLMEYLAALHLSEQPKSTLLVVFSRKLDDPFATSRFNIVLRFFFGISFSSLIVEKKDTCIAVKAIEYVATSCFNPSLTLCHCVFESQNDVIIHEATQYVQKPLFTDVCSIGEIQTAHDFSATLAVLARIEELNCMKLIFSHCGIGTTQIIQLTDVLASKCGKVQVRCLNLSGNILTGECVSYLFLRASAAFKPDKKDNNQSDIKFNSQAISRSVGLSYLDISDILFRACDLLELENVVRNKVFSNLNHLNLKGCLTGDADINVKSLTTFLEALSTNCPRMVELNLSSNKLGVPGASAVARGVSRFQKYLDVSTYYDSFRLHFDDNNLGDEGFKAFVDNLDGMYNFSYLSLSGNSIHAAGVSYLAEAVCSRGIVMNKYVNRVDLSDNPLRIEGNKHINRMLSSSHCQFQKIDLCRCELAVTGSGISNTDSVSRGRSISIESAVIDIGQQICLMPINRTITRLKLDGNCFTSDGVHILISIMQHCICLQKLSCTNCGITSDDIVLLLRNISHFKITSPELCSRLVSWKLDNNQICNRGGTALIDHLPSIFKGYLSDFGYSVISLEDNPVDRDVRTKLNEELNLICKKRKNKFWLSSMDDTAISEREDETTVSESEDKTTISEVQVQEHLSTQPSLVNQQSRQTVGDRQVSSQQDLDDRATRSQLKLPQCLSPSISSSQPMPCRPHPLSTSHPDDDQNDTVAAASSQTICVGRADLQTSPQKCPPATGERPNQLQDNDRLEESGPSLLVDDLASVLTAVWKGRAKWYNIGLLLGLPVETLDAIRLTNHCDADQCFTETLKEWLKQSEHPSWSDLAGALRAEPVGLEYLVKKLPNFDPSK